MNTRIVVLCVASAVIVTLYSLSELHTLSEQHVQEDAQGFATSSHLSSGSNAANKPQITKQASTVSSTFSQTTYTFSSSSKATTSVVQTSNASVKKCFFYEHTELWGDVVEWGTKLKVDNVGQCCDACRNHVPETAEDPECNVFVFCGDEKACGDKYRQCWLKHLVRPAATKPARQGPACPWTSGTIDVDMNGDPMKDRPANLDTEARRFHIITSAQGAAVHWQARVHYYWYKKQKAACEAAGKCEMGGFTRLLHSGEPDDLMDEIPTMVVDPLPQDMVEHSWYVVLNRPYAFVQWVKRATIPERYVLMSEPDHVFIRPLPNFMNGDNPAAFPFFYIEPAKAENAKITQKFTGPISKRQLEEIAPIGNSPTYMRFDDMAKTMPLWMNTSIAIFKDQEANKEWGWVQEMYGFTIALWMAGIKKVDLFLNMMAQPPWDADYELAPGRPYYILHYTYGMDYKLTGEFTPGKYGEWRFDKRSWGGKPITRNLGEPPKNMKNDLVRFLINAFNEATDAIPCWDEYAQTGKVPKVCTEAPKHFLAEEAAKKKATGFA